MARLFEVAAQIATPLGLAGVVVIVLFLLYRGLIRGPLATQLSGSHSFRVINRLITYVFILGLVAITFSISAYLVVQLRPTPTVEEPTGFLSPGNAPTPATACPPLKPGEFVLLAGGNTVVMSLDTRHYTAIAFNGQPRVWINSDDQGVYVSADIVREDRRTVATLRHNRFSINTNNYYELRRPNRHELAVIDKSSMVVLRAEFLNEQAFRLQGRFVQPGYGTLLIRADDFTWLIPGHMGNLMRGNCVSNSGRAGINFSTVLPPELQQVLGGGS